MVHPPRRAEADQRHQLGVKTSFDHLIVNLLKAERNDDESRPCNVVSCIGEKGRKSEEHHGLFYGVFH